MKRIGNCVVVYNSTQQLYKIYFNNELIVECHTENSVEHYCTIINKTQKLCQEQQKQVTK